MLIQFLIWPVDDSKKGLGHLSPYMVFGSDSGWKSDEIPKSDSDWLGAIGSIYTENLPPQNKLSPRTGD